MKRKAVFFGSYEFILPVLQVVEEQFELQLVVTTETLATGPITVYCKKNSLPYVSIKSFAPATIEQIKVYNADIAVLAYFGLFIPDSLLQIFPLGIINIHPSLLPKYRGPSPVQTAILNGDTTTGVTIIKLDHELDHGPIFIQQEEPIHPNDTLEILHARLFQKGAMLFKEIIPLIEKRMIEAVPQDDTKATYTKKLTRESGYIDKANPPDHKMLDRMIRAYYPWPGVWTKVKMKKFGKGDERQEVRIKLLPNKMLQIEGKKPITQNDFYNGYPELKESMEKLSL